MRTMALSVLLFLAAGGNAFSQIAASLDQPQCYEGVGCPHKDKISESQLKGYSCENLWLVRNTILHQRGYCFQTKRGQAEFSNKNCSVKAVSELKLGSVEKANVATLEKVEKSKRCQ